VNEILKLTIENLNSKLSDFPECAQLELKSIMAARKLNSAHLGKKGKNELNFQIVFLMRPADAIFEVNAVAGTEKERSVKFLGDVLRVNQYGNQSACLDSYGARVSWIRSVCYCGAS
jgi:hypothetical protein